MRMSDPMGKLEHHALFYTLVASTSFAQKNHLVIGRRFYIVLCNKNETTSTAIKIKQRQPQSEVPWLQALERSDSHRSSEQFRQHLSTASLAGSPLQIASAA